MQISADSCCPECATNKSSCIYQDQNIPVSILINFQIYTFFAQLFYHMHSKCTHRENIEENNCGTGKKM